MIGTTVEAVESRGKHLIVRFSNRLALHTHMRMSGSWHLYRRGERWRLPRHLARVVLRTADFEAICFSAPTIELLSADELCQHELCQHAGLASLGPDLLAANFDGIAARQRLSALADLQIGPALLDQRALAGIGNVYKSETLFLCRQSPFEPVAHLSAARLDHLIAQARRLLHSNTATSRRITTDQPRRGAELWVYGRAGRPCRRCAAPIRVARQAARATYWCDTCQAPGA